jgi:hypothetical protein
MDLADHCHGTGAWELVRLHDSNYLNYALKQRVSWQTKILNTYKYTDKFHHYKL